jgi:hypothetical protein
VDSSLQETLPGGRVFRGVISQVGIQIVADSLYNPLVASFGQVFLPRFSADSVLAFEGNIGTDYFIPVHKCGVVETGGGWVKVSFVPGESITVPGWILGDSGWICDRATTVFSE